MNKKKVIAAIKSANPGMTVKWIPETSEYRVAFHPSVIGKDTESSAYYTNDIDDAACTARAMWNHKFGVDEPNHLYRNR